MYVRLAFAVAAHLDSEILLVDEVLAVGDAQFQKKCLGKMEDISSKGGRTILFVSHNMGAVVELCTKAVLLKQGQVANVGPVNTVIEDYTKVLAKNESRFKPGQDTSLPCSILKLSLSSNKGVETTLFDIADEIILTITYRLRTKIEGFHLVVTLSRYAVDLLHSYDVDNMKEIPPRGPGLYQTQLRIPRMFLKAGSYSFTIVTTDQVKEYQWLNSVLSFEIEEHSQNTNRKGYRKDRHGFIISPAVWDTKKIEENDQPK
jgi:lipopolysaccharide transport system ATP-binding protein